MGAGVQLPQGQVHLPEREGAARQVRTRTRRRHKAVPLVLQSRRPHEEHLSGHAPDHNRRQVQEPLRRDNPRERPPARADRAEAARNRHPRGRQPDHALQEALLRRAVPLRPDFRRVQRHGHKVFRQLRQAASLLAGVLLDGQAERPTHEPEGLCRVVPCPRPHREDAFALHGPERHGQDSAGDASVSGLCRGSPRAAGDAHLEERLHLAHDRCGQDAHIVQDGADSRRPPGDHEGHLPC